MVAKDYSKRWPYKITESIGIGKIERGAILDIGKEAHILKIKCLSQIKVDFIIISPS